MKKIYLIDANNLIYRMFFALPEFHAPDGQPVNAIFGVAKWIVNSLCKQNPDYVFFIRDARGTNFRHELYNEYKATRDKMPDDLRSQIALMETMIQDMGIDIISTPGYEADDVIGTLAHHFGKNPDLQVHILSSDKDLHSLVTQNVHIYDMMKRVVFTPDKTTEKFGVAPEYIIDYLAIMGDSSDNIPGIDGFGPKKAVDLIQNIGSIEQIYEIADELESGNKDVADLPQVVQSCFKGKTFEKLTSSRENAFLSKKLATIELNIDSELILEQKHNSFEDMLEHHSFHADQILSESVKSLFATLGFHSLYEDEVSLKTWKDTGLKVQIIGDTKALESLKNTIQGLSADTGLGRKIVLDTETTSLNIMQAELVGVSIYIDDNNIYYINRGHTGASVDDTGLKEFLRFLLKSDLIIIGHNIKYDLQIIQLFLENSIEKVQVKTGEQIGLGI